MSDDSDTDLFPTNVLTFQSQGTTVCAKGPNVNSTNISNLSFRNNVMTSTMNMPWNFERPRYAESVCDQRSMCYRRDREASPMSFHSASGMQSRNFHYSGGIGSHQSRYNSRSGSPMSVRTINSNTSMSAKDIVFAFQNGTFNKFELKTIKDAYKHFMKNRARKKVEKRRNIKMFLKGFRRKSGGDSGDQASESSASSDECRSTRTSRTIYKENMSSCRSTRTDVSDFRKRIRESNMVIDCSDNFRQNHLKGISSESISNSRENWKNLQHNKINSSYSLKDRFKNGFLLPSQRFNQSVASIPIEENPNRLQRTNGGIMQEVKNSAPNKIYKAARNYDDTDSEQYEIFGDVTVMEKTSINENGKRIHEGDNVSVPKSKKTKPSPKKNIQEPIILKSPPITLTKRKSDFVFAKPQLPIKKPAIAKQKSVCKLSQPQQKVVQQTEEKSQLFNTGLNPPNNTMRLPVEKVISSSQKAVETLISNSIKLNSEKPTIQTTLQSLPQEEKQFAPSDTLQHSTTDISMRPSFIKRKLFSQKIDVADKNSSSDTLQIDSPQTNVYSKIQKEKNRARKLVTSQSCLNRDIGDDSNLLELIYKIVPADRMNVTSAANRSEIHNKPTNTDKWDVTSIITNCNNSDDVSDTYTDEEIFQCDVNKKSQNKNKKENNNNIQKDSTVNEQSSIDKPTQTKTVPMVKEQTHGNEVIKVKEKTADNEVKSGNTKNKISLQNKVVKEPQNIQHVTAAPQCKILIDRAVSYQTVSPTVKNGKVMLTVYKSVKSFWDTDTESDLDTTPLKTTPLKRVDAKPIGSSNPETIKNTEHQNVNTVDKQQNVNLPQKNIGKNEKKSLSITSCKKESGKRNKEINKPIQNQIVNTKTTEKGSINNKDTNKLRSSKKENPPNEVLNQTSTNKTRTLRNSNPKCKPELPQLTVNKCTLDKTKSKIINNNDKQSVSNHNNTLRIRAQRKPKVDRCCGEDDSLINSVANNDSTLCKTLRSRQIDLSTSIQSDEDRQKSNSSMTKKTVLNSKKNDLKTKEKRPNKIKKKMIANDSDVSFTLMAEVQSSDRTLRMRKTSTRMRKVEQKNRPSDVSFTLRLEDDDIFNKSICTRSSKKNREIVSLQNNSAIFFKSGRTANKYIAAKSRELNKSDTARFNRSRQLI